MDGEIKMDTKKYLRQIHLFDVQLNNKIEQLDSLKDLTTKVTTTWKTDSVSGSGSQDRLGDTVAKIVDLEAEINREIDKYIDKKREICSVIEQVENTEQLQVLYKRYVEYKTLERIAVELNYSYRNICYIHGRALQAVTAILSEVNEE